MKERDRKTATCPQQQRSREECRNICLATQRKGEEEPYLKAIYECCRQGSKGITCLYHLQYPHSIKHCNRHRSHTALSGQITGQYQHCSAARFGGVEVTNNNYLCLPVLNATDRPRHPQTTRSARTPIAAVNQNTNGTPQQLVIPSEISVLRCQEGRSQIQSCLESNPIIKYCKTAQDAIIFNEL